MRYIIYAAFFVLCSHQYSQAGSLMGSERVDSLKINPLFFESADGDNVFFYLYTKNALLTGMQLKIDDTNTLKSSGFDVSKKTVIIIHGFKSNVSSEITQSIKDALLEYDVVNIIGVDWSHFADKPTLLYIDSLLHVRHVGRFVGEMVNFLISQGLEPSKVHLVGHSLGAHVSGFAGKLLKEYNRKLGRISGLDPALPGFVFGSRLASDDADFVDCIHTSIGLGNPFPICQANFYPNSGFLEPGCEDNKFFDEALCSHSKSYQYFASSINPQNKFKVNCEFADDARMGYYADPRCKGDFGLETTDKYPFSKRMTTST